MLHTFNLFTALIASVNLEKVDCNPNPSEYANQWSSQAVQTQILLYTYKLKVLVISSNTYPHCDLGMEEEKMKKQACKTQMLLKNQLVTVHIIVKVSGRDTYLQFSHTACIKKELGKL